MSDRERPDVVAYEELERVIHSLAEEMAGWRKRALQAESRLKQYETARDAPPTPRDKVAALQRENADLRNRLDAARDGARQLLDRVRFLRQQHEHGAER